MSFLLDPIDSAINSLLDPLTATAAATSANTIDPIETSTGDSEPAATSILKTTKSSKSSPTATSTDATSTSSVHSKVIPSSLSASPTTQSTLTTSDTSSSSSSSSATISTITTSSPSSASSSTSNSNPLAPSASASSSAQPLSPSQSQATSTPSTSTPSSGSGISTAGIAVASIIAFALLVSIIFLIIRFCPPVRKRIDAWYEKRREERTWRAAIDGVAAEKGLGSASGSLSSASGSSVDKTRPFSFFALGKNPQLYHEQTNSASARDNVAGPPSYVSPTSATAEPYTPMSARLNGHNSDKTQGTGLGLGRVSLLRNTSLLRKAGFDAPSPPPQVPRQLQLPQHVAASTSTPITRNRTSQGQAQVGRVLRPTTSQIRRKPLPIDPPGVDRGRGMPVNSNLSRAGEREQRPRERSTSTSIGAFSIDHGLMPIQPGYSQTHSHSRSDSLPKLQIQIPGQLVESRAGSRAESRAELAGNEWDGRCVSRSQIGVAVSGSPMSATRPDGRESR